MDMTIKVDDLRDIIQENRDNHEALYAEAVIVYRVKAIDALEAQITNLQSPDGPLALTWRLPVPEKHLEDYDRILKVLELTIDEEITLDDAEVAMYIMNEWGWLHSWAANTVAYTSS